MLGGGEKGSSAAAMLLFSDETQTLGTAPTAGQVLTSDGTSITGLTLGGGTPTPTAVGDIMYSADGATWTRLAVGAIGRHLAVSGSLIPSWREMAQQGTAAARPAASIAVESVLYWSTDAAAGLELAQCIHTGSGAYSWKIMPHDVTATGVALAQATDAAAGRTAISAQASSAVLDSYVAIGTPGNLGEDMLTRASASEGRDLLELGTIATLNTATSPPLPKSVSTPATLVARTMWQWNLCSGSDIPDLIANPPTGTTWQQSAKLTAASRTSNVITLTHNGTDFDGVAAQTNPLLWVGVDGAWRFVCRFRSKGNELYENAGMEARWATGTTGQIQVRKNEMEVYHNGSSRATVAISQDQWVWGRMVGNGVGGVSYYWSTSTAEPTITDVTGASPSTAWVLVYRENLPVTSVNGVTWLGIMTERVNSGSTSGTYDGEFSTARLEWDG